MRKALVVFVLSVLACGTYNTPTTIIPTPTRRPVGTPEMALVSDGYWNCRSMVGGPVVAYASSGQEVEILERAGGWARVVLAGQECWLIERAIQ